MDEVGERIIKALKHKNKVDYTFDDGTELSDVIKTARYLVDNGFMTSINHDKLNGWGIFARRFTDFDLSMFPVKQRYATNVLYHYSSKDLDEMAKIGKLFKSNGFRAVYYKKDEDTGVYTIMVEAYVFPKDGKNDTINGRARENSKRSCKVVL